MTHRGHILNENIDLRPQKEVQRINTFLKAEYELHRAIALESVSFILSTHVLKPMFSFHPNTDHQTHCSVFIYVCVTSS